MNWSKHAITRPLEVWQFTTEVSIDNEIFSKNESKLINLCRTFMRAGTIYANLWIHCTSHTVSHVPHCVSRPTRTLIDCRECLVFTWQAVQSRKWLSSHLYLYMGLLYSSFRNLGVTFVATSGVLSVSRTFAKELTNSSLWRLNRW